ncbi:MAG: hypothetical protein WAU39_09995, partial [Polyangiales bacterium]
LRIRDFPSKITYSLGRRRDGRSHLCLLHHDSMLPRPDSLIFSLGVSHATLARGGSRGVPTSRGDIIHNLPGGVRIRESTGSIELLSDPRDQALEELVKLAKERFRSGQVRLIGSRHVRRRLATLAVYHDLVLSREHER